METLALSRNASNPEGTLKIVVLGAGAVGKSSLILRYLHGLFTDNYSPTLQEVFQKIDKVDGNPVSLEITDTAGQEDYIVMQDQWIRDAMGFVLVYAINKEDTFEEIKSIKRRIDKIKPKSPIVIVGNKVDMEQSRKIDTKTGQELAASYGAMFIETSAKTGLNCEEAFRMLVKELRGQEKKPEPKVVVAKQKKSFLDFCTLI